MLSLIFFISSLCPIFVCTAIMYSDIDYVFWTSIALMIVGVVGFLLLILIARLKSKGKSFKVSKISAERDFSAVLLFSYVLPLIAFDLKIKEQAICFLIILVVYGIVYIRNRIFHFNIFLYILGYKCYKGLNDRGDVITIIHRGKWGSLECDEVNKIDLAGDIWLSTNRPTRD